MYTFCNSYRARIRNSASLGGNHFCNEPQLVLCIIPGTASRWDTIFLQTPLWQTIVIFWNSFEILYQPWVPIVTLLAQLTVTASSVVLTEALSCGLIAVALLSAGMAITLACHTTYKTLYTISPTLYWWGVFILFGFCMSIISVTWSGSALDTNSAFLAGGITIIDRTCQDG